MNTKQRVLLWCVAVIQVMMVLVLPRRTYLFSQYHYSFPGYQFIWHTNWPELDIYLYFIQWSLLITVGFVAYHLLRDK